MEVFKGQVGQALAYLFGGLKHSKSIMSSLRFFVDSK